MVRNHSRSTVRALIADAHTWRSQSSAPSDLTTCCRATCIACTRSEFDVSIRRARRTPSSSASSGWSFQRECFIRMLCKPECFIRMLRLNALLECFARMPYQNARVKRCASKAHSKAIQKAARRAVRRQATSNVFISGHTVRHWRWRYFHYSANIIKWWISQQVECRVIILASAVHVLQY